MKNQYFGDINDYRKYGLLRTLQSELRAQLLIAWMLTQDDGSQDGGLRDYLHDSERWRHYDPKLFDELALALRSVSRPAVSLIERSELLPNAKYYTSIVPDQRTEREVWRSGLFEAARDVDLAFVDPDNGLAVSSVPVGRKNSSKYVTWGEIEGLWSAGCSVLVYQHFRREPRSTFASRMMSELTRRTKAPLTEAFRTPHVLFLLAAQERHVKSLRNAIHILQKTWNGQIEPMGQASNAAQASGFADG